LCSTYDHFQSEFAKKDTNDDIKSRILNLQKYN
jgi:hypothetical protein